MKKNNVVHLVDINIDKNAVLSVIGSNGKTTLVNRLANFYKNEDFSVLVTTTTKMLKEEIENYTFIDYQNSSININKKNVYVTYKHFTPDNLKIIGISKDDVDIFHKNFDITIIEADGSRKKSLKGYKPYEPVIAKSTTHTIGVISFIELNKKMTTENIHNLEEFLKVVDAKEGDTILLSHLHKIIVSENGIFRNSIGKKYIYISHMESEQYDKIFTQFLEEFDFPDISFIR